jgi:hypothetical protein
VSAVRDDKTKSRLFLAGAGFVVVIGYVYWEMNKVADELIRSNATENAALQ